MQEDDQTQHSPSHQTTDTASPKGTSRIKLLFGACLLGAALLAVRSTGIASEETTYIGAITETVTRKGTYTWKNLQGEEEVSFNLEASVPMVFIADTVSFLQTKTDRYLGSTSGNAKPDHLFVLVVCEITNNGKSPYDLGNLLTGTFFLASPDDTNFPPWQGALHLRKEFEPGYPVFGPSLTMEGVNPLTSVKPLVVFQVPRRFLEREVSFYHFPLNGVGGWLFKIQLKKAGPFTFKSNSLIRFKDLDWIIE